MTTKNSILLLALMACLAMPASAAPVLYTDRPSFIADPRVGSTGSINFDDLSVGADLTTQTVAGVTFETAAGNLLVVIVASNGVRNAMSPSTPLNVLSPGGSDVGLEEDDLTLTFAQPVRAAGLDVVFDDPDGASFVGVTFLDSSNNVIASNGFIPSPAGAPGFQFVGAVSDSADIKKVVLDDFDGSAPDEHVAYDSVTFSSTQFLGPCPYLSFADSPFNGAECSYSHLEDFEDGLLNVTGVVASAGGPTGPGGNTDSVDGDDGAIDGFGTLGHSFFSSPGSVGVTFTFSTNVLGALPTFAGIVWTDGAGDTSFEAFDENGTSLGTNGPVAIADGSIVGETPEDRFFGVVNAAGISAIKISNTAGGIEVDHLQYGLCAGSLVDPCPSNPVVEIACVLEPSVATNTVGETHTVTATVTSNGVPIGGVNVTFNLTGANGAVQTNITTADNGQASFSYTGLNAGTDNILAAGAVDATEFSCDASKVWIEAPSDGHDLAVVSVKPPKNINLKGAEPSLTKRVKVQIQNLGDHEENITSLAQLANLVTVEVHPLGEGECATPSANLILGPPNKPKLLKQKKKLNVFFDVTFTCAIDPAKGVPDFTYSATVHHDALGTGNDSVPANDICPRADCTAPVTDVFIKQ